jgi:glycine cleavage system H protein
VSDIPNDLQYTKNHEWIRRLPNGWAEIGITDHAQSTLGDLVFVEIPEVSRAVAAGVAVAVVESVKAASDVYSPVNGRVAESNTELTTRPELLNQDPYGAGWLARIEVDAGPGVELLSAAEYAQYLASEAK